MIRFCSLLFVVVCFTTATLAQVSVNTDGSLPDPSAMLDVKSTSQGLLIPRLTSTEQSQIPSPAIGLLVYNTTSKSLNYFNGEGWLQLTSTLVTSNTGNISPGGGIAITSPPGGTPHSSAILDISNSSRGVLLPFISPNDISSPATGLMIFSTLANRLVYFNGYQWIEPCYEWAGVYGGGGSQSRAGVAINANGAEPDPSAMLDVRATGKGVLIPRMTDSDRDNLLPVDGLIIYNTSSNTIEFYNGSGWYQLNSPVVPSITITPSATLVEQGETVTFTANPVNGGSSPGYQWNVNYMVSGADPTFTYTPSNGDLVQCILISSLTCVPTNIAYSERVPVSVVTPCPGVSPVTYEGKVYHTVKVGDQCWMRENLNIGAMVSRYSEQSDNNILEKYCYNDSEANCDVYGGLYQWGELVQYLNGASNTTTWDPVPTGNIQGLCPSGWHIPKSTEWTALINNAGGSFNALSSLKESGGLHWASNIYATNSSGFTALPSGARFNGGFFMGMDWNQFEMHWSATVFNNQESWYFYLDNSTVTGDSYMATKKHGFALRCIKDN